MEKLLLWKNQITQWFTSGEYKDRKTVFLVISVVLSLFVTLHFEFGFKNVLIFLTSIVIAWSLSSEGIATVKLEYMRVASAWGFINYSLMVTIVSLMVKEEVWGNRYTLGILVACFASYLLVISCSYISYLLRLNPTEKDYSLVYSDFFSDSSYRRFNRCVLYFVISSIFVMAYSYLYERNIERDYEFSQEKYYPVTEWRTEIRNGNTIYIIKCKKGIIGIYPFKHPEIRNINSRTKVKYLNNSSAMDLIIPDKIDIKN